MVERVCLNRRRRIVQLTLLRRQGRHPADDGHILAMVGGRDFFGADDDASSTCRDRADRLARR